MSVRTETFGHQAPRIPLVSVIATVLAFAVGIALGAIVMDRDTAGTTDAPGAAVEAPRGWDRGMLDAAAQRAAGLNPTGFLPGFQPRDAGLLQISEQTAGVPVVPGIQPWDAGMLAAAEQMAGLTSTVNGWDQGKLDAASQRAQGQNQPTTEYIPYRHQTP